jgi:hypothetical protein
MSKLVLIALLSVGALCAQNRAVSRTPDGYPDLQGVWTNATLTPVERPAALAGNNLFIDRGSQLARVDGVNDTTNFTGKTHYRGSSDNLHVIERFTKADTGTLLYKVTVDDPLTCTKQWTMEYPFLAMAGPLYEYARHEGNYAMTDILGGARKDDGGARRDDAAKGK